ncbi:MAG: DUF1501 domain-containing protein [Planctomycetota bacterium]
MHRYDLFANADPLTRRGFLAGTARRLLGVAAVPSLSRLAAAASAQDPGDGPIALLPATARNVIYLFMRGGMSHLDTFDPKPGAKTQGPVEAIATAADGVQLSQHFPLLARQMHRAAVVCSMQSTQGAHQQAQYLMRTSYSLRGTIQHPSLGAWVNRLAGRINSTLPGHVLVGGGNDMPTAGFFPPQFLPLPVGDAETGLKNSQRAPGVDEQTFGRRLERLQAMNDAFEQRYGQRRVKAYAEVYRDAVRLMNSADLVAFDLGLETGDMRAAYGDDDFGQGCLLARRLVEHGVRYVEVVSNGWDTHNQNFDTLSEKCPPVDRALAALLADLDARGLLAETLVVVATEFGRSPDITKDNNGRNHYPKAFSALLAGGGVRGGVRYGQTDAEGREVVDSPVSVPDLNATIAYALGLPLDHKLHSPSGRPFTVADKGRPVLGLFA